MSSSSTNQPRTILGPLTTTYTQSSSCGLIVERCTGCSIAYLAQTCLPSPTYAYEDNFNCWPPRSSAPGSTIATPAGALLGWGLYSPGLVCPAGMTSACSATGGGSSGWPVQYTLLEGETAVGCCPTYFACAPSIRAPF